MFSYDGGTYNRIYLNLSTPSGSVYDSMLVTEGDSTTTHTYSKNAPARTKVRFDYRDYDLNIVSYSCNGTVNVY